VFGNGTGFVWYGGGAQEKDVVEGALIVEMKAGLVTVHEAQGGFGGEVLEGVGYAIERIGGSLSGGFIFEQSGFDGPGAAETPVGSDHFLDQGELHAIGGLQATEVLIEDGVKTFRLFIAHDDLAGEQPVTGGILRRTALAGDGDGFFWIGDAGRVFEGAAGVVATVRGARGSDIDAAANGITTITFEKAMLADALLVDLQTINKEMLKVVHTKDKSPLKIVKERRAMYLASLERLEKLETEKEGREIIDRFKAAVTEGREANLKVAKMVEEERWDDAVPFYHRYVDPSVDNFMAIIGELVKFQEKEIRENMEKTRNVGTKTK